VNASFVYDADGNRVKGTIGGVTTVYLAGLYEYQAGATTHYYEGGGLRRTGYAAHNGLYYVLQDQLQSNSTFTNQAGVLVGHNRYYLYSGNRGSGPFLTRSTKRFTGQYHEQDLPGGEGLSYYNARWYDAKLGRFVSADTMVPNPANPQDLNRFTYAANNPLRYTDPSGHCPVCPMFDPGPGGGGGGGNTHNNGLNSGSWWTPVSDFFFGAASQWGYNNSWITPTYQTRFAQQPGESVAMTIGRHAGNLASMA
jgi:RHS repeat-associated protein